ncbi:MarR family transcriptional regulator [Nonomuraea longispora]|uniref:MarR family transcriptional regulator n=1 Tax=Nonomuraea longispora TaxID=1848320 RepID=A0A4R4NH12_9ACTN|nr:MarR family transcriptional regulator [Nonomuraea longispora]
MKGYHAGVTQPPAGDRIRVITRDPDLGILAARLLFSLQREVFARLAERGHGDVRPRHGAILAYLDAGGVRATELARLSGRHKQIVGRLVDELETLGYVERRPDPADRRAKLVVPTERGLDQQRQADDIIAAIERRHAATIGEPAYAHLRQALKAITAEHHLRDGDA